MSAVVGVLGGGSWGTVLAHIISQKGNRVLLWLRDEDVAQQINSSRVNQKYLPGVKLDRKVEATVELARLPAETNVLFLAVPSTAVRETAYFLGDHVLGDQIIISAVKGLERETYKPMSIVIKEETCVKKVGVLSGPNLAKEIGRGLPCAMVVASAFEQVIASVTQLVASPGFRIYANHDVVGVETGGALANVVAIAAGISDGLGLGINTKAVLLTRGLEEMRRMGVELGADPLTFSGLSGLGDMLVACTSPSSVDYQVGNRLGQGESFSAVMADLPHQAEGVVAARVADQFCRTHRIRLPIMQSVYSILYESAESHQLQNAYMTASAEQEYEIDRPVVLEADEESI